MTPINSATFDIGPSTRLSLSTRASIAELPETRSKSKTLIFRQSSCEISVFLRLCRRGVVDEQIIEQYI